MTKLQNLFSNFFKSQTVKTSLLTIIFVALCAPLFAQTVNVVSTGVYYTDNATADKDTDGTTSDQDRALYCNGYMNGGKLATWESTDTVYDRSFIVSGVDQVNPDSNRTTNDPWVSSALIEYDQPYPSPTVANKYPNHCLGLCSSFSCSNLPVGQTTYSVSFPIQRITFDIFKYYNGKNPKSADETPTIRSIDVYPARDTSNYANYTCGSYHCSNAGKDDNKNSQVAECLGAHWICSGTTMATGAGGSGITCGMKRDTEEKGGAVIEDSVYCWSGSSSAGTLVDWTPFISCGVDSSDTNDSTVICMPQNGTSQSNTNCPAGSDYCQVTGLSVPANATGSLCWPATTTKKEACDSSTVAPLTHGTPMTSTNRCYAYYGVNKFKQCQGIATSATQFNGCCEGPGHSDCVIFDGNGAETNEALSFCTGWDGFYEIAGEFGKSNGDFGFRATAYTNVPSDGVIADRIEIEEPGVYPGHNGATQIPIQIDVTNVHMVRSTPSLVGTITPVSAQPYTFTYRLSKDADVRIAIFDASTLDSEAYASAAQSGTRQVTYTHNVEVGRITQSFASVCQQIGGTMDGSTCVLLGTDSTQAECNQLNVGATWTPQSSTRISSVDMCQAMGGTGGTVCEGLDHTTCEDDYGFPWDPVTGECTVTVSEGSCMNFSQYSWHDGGCYLDTQTSCTLNALNALACRKANADYTWNGTQCEEIQYEERTETREEPIYNGPISGNSFAASYEDATKKIVRTLVDWQPRTGEGMKGQEKDTQISDFDSWDGRNDDGLLLPAGNYLASIQAKSQDEWPGIDFSRAVTRQVSLDPLKLTDVQVTGLNKKSTAYATISYVPTEPSTVYWEVYTPGTRFVTQETTSTQGNAVSAVLTNSSAPTGTGPTRDTTGGNITGSLVYRSAEQKSGRMNYTDRWDGTCQALDSNGDPANCVRTYAAGERKSNGQIAVAGETETFAYGAPMPDGNYVYVLWAEIPYNGCYHNAADAAPTSTSATTEEQYYGEPHFEANKECSYSAANNNRQFTGVKTLKYTVGTLELERGLVGITLQPVGYATLGSSPTAYGLDPFIFKYALDRDAQVIATVENTAGVVVKHITLKEGEPNVSQQLNTLTWDGRDDQGRMVYPGTYMFRVKAMDAMFPAQSNEAIVVFPVDMYRVVDVATTDVYGDSNAKATISYHLSKTMNTQINIYNKDVVIPDYNALTGEYNGAKVTATYTAKSTDVAVGSLAAYGMHLTPTSGGEVYNLAPIPANGSIVEYSTATISDVTNTKVRNTWTSASEYNIEGDRDLNADLTNYDGETNNERNANTYTVYLKQEVLDVNTDVTAAWPPRICNTTDDVKYGASKNQSIFYKNGDADVVSGKAKVGAVNPAKVNQYNAACIYVNDKTFTNYPATAEEAASGVLDVRLQPIHTINRTKLSNGDDVINMEEWDALYFYNPTPDSGRHTQEEITKCQNQNEKANCPYEMLPDGQYPFFLSARSNEPFNRYYYDAQRDVGKTFGSGHTYTISGEPFRQGRESDNVQNIDVQQEDYLYASDKVVSKINVTRGPVYFLDGSVAVFANAPQLFNASSTTLTFIPPYEINFSISRAAQVEVAIVALEPNMCSPVTDNVLSSNVNVYESRTNAAGEICKFLSTMTIANTGHFDANAIRKIYWDGTDHVGNYVKPGIYEVRLTARNYPDAGLYDPTVKSITLNADLLKVFDLLEADNYAISERGQNMKIGYQVSVPMKVAIQIFKPGTTIFDYSKGTLRNPTTGLEVQDIREVLVRSIVGIRPGTTLVEEVWDGLDYAGQEVPDGIYPFRFVTSLDTAAIDTVTGEVLFGDDTSADPMKWKIQRVADTYEYQNLHKATIAIGDGRFVCDDWKKTVFFYPNPLNDASKGTLEITKMPVPGTISIKYFNLAGDLVRNADYDCVDANNYRTTIGSNFYFQPDNNISTTRLTNDELVESGTFKNVRNAALRCKWDRTNQHGKKVARGVYFGLVDFKAYNGREHCQKVVKILIP